MSTDSAASSDPLSGDPCRGGLRERKKAQTRHALHAAALDLAEEGGVAAVTVEAIAERAEVSPRTFFNYYASKEDAFLGIDPDVPERLAAALVARPVSEPLPLALRGVLTDYILELARDEEAWRRRRTLLHSSPALVTSWLGANNRLSLAFVDAAIERSGRDIGDDLSSVVQAYSALGAIRAATRQHHSRGFDGDISTCLDDAFAALGPEFSPAHLFVVSVAIRNDDDALLIVRKRGTRCFMLPGGKVEPGESRPEAAAREVAEEVTLSYRAAELRSRGVFTAPAANEPGLTIESEVFAPDPMPRTEAAAAGEIEEIRWLALTEEAMAAQPLAPLLTRHVIPMLTRETARAGV